MVGWRLFSLLFLVFFHLAFVNPQCTVCTTPSACKPFDGGPIASTNVTIRCDDTTGDVNFTDERLDNVTSPNVTVSPAEASTTGPSSSQITVEDFLSLNRKIFATVRYLNISYNSIESFNESNASLIGLDLSHNLITNITHSQFPPQLAHLDVSHNHLASLVNFSHSALHELEANHNNITNLTLGSFPNLKSLNLGENEISKIDKNFSNQVPRLEILNLTTNSIAQLNDYSFNLSSLLRLHLGNNKLSFLSEKCFYGLSRLQFLDISNNRITQVFPSMFQYIPLVRLDVSNNPNLMTQDFGILLASERLKSVNASRTNQVKIPACLTRSVRYLSLSHNNISQIQCGDLDSYPLLNSLDLSHNNISFIEDDALGRLELLETIILSHNRLTFIPYTLSSNLKGLYLDHNHLSKITPADFAGLLKLKYLDLSRSNVTSITEGSFSQMYGLVSLNLSMNPIQVVSIGTFSGPHKLKVLDLSGLNSVSKCKQDLCFPVPEPNELSELYIEGSPELANRLMNDAAALKTFKQLNLLNMERCNLTEIMTDASNYFPRLRYLYLEGNELNCSAVFELYVWSDVSQPTDCRFVINEKVTTVPSLATRVPSTSGNLTFNVDATTEISLEIFIQNNSLRYSQEAEVISNEIWISDDQMGDVDAYSGEAPSSHPGLFVMLLVPVTLAGAVLFLNFHRLKKKAHTERRREMDIEISNISSELW